MGRKFLNIFSQMVVVSVMVALGACTQTNEPENKINISQRDGKSYPMPIININGTNSTMAEALQAAQAGQWSYAASKAAQLNDPAGKIFIEWLELKDPTTSPDFNRLTNFIDNNPEWANIDIIKAKAETKAMNELDVRSLYQWLLKHQPTSFVTKIRLAELHAQNGKMSEAIVIIKDLWANQPMRLEYQQRILQNFSGNLQFSDHVDRLENMLWTKNYESARNMFSLVSNDYVAYAKARIALQTRSSNAIALMNAVPSSLRHSSGMQFDHIFYLRKQNRDNEVVTKLANLSDAYGKVQPERWWEHRGGMLRYALKNFGAKTAYQIAANHNMKAETVQAGDAEWHAGWLALRFLNNPQAAEKHFETMLDKIYMPISEARGYYWLGRARQAQGKTAAAHKAFEQAANYGFTFYGQLAAERLGLKNAKLPSSIEVSASKQAAFEAKNMVKAVKLLANVSPARTQRRILLTHMAMNTKDEAEQKLIGALAHAAGEDTFSVKLAKMAMRQGVFVKDMSYPAPHYFRGKAKSSEDALLMALTRQESEYDTDAISHVGARGLMQLMPGTAREVSNKLGLGYSDFKLNNDPDYNIMLGTYYIEQQVNRFDGSYVLALAGYNAGPSRAINWSSTFGNPQSSDVDAVDFIELIPFEETRNYVQRIMETVPIYRSILNNEPVKATLSKDLKR